MGTNIEQALFQPLETQTRAEDEIVRPSLTYWQDAWRRLKANKPAMIGLTIIIIIVLSAIFVPLFVVTLLKLEDNQVLRNIPEPTALGDLLYALYMGVYRSVSGW